MRRKVIKQGHNTLTITLPSGWAKNNNLNPGDDIFLNENDNKLLLSTNAKDDVNKVEFDISNMSIPVIWNYFMCIYREGYDEIKICFDPDAKYDSPYKYFARLKPDKKYITKIKKTPPELLREITNRFVGLEIIEQHHNHCIIKNMVQFTNKEFDVTLKRIFFLIKHMFRKIYEGAEANDPKIVQHIHDEDINVDKFHDYCMRILNKTGLTGSKKHSIYFSTLYILELLADELKNISMHFISDFGKNPNFENMVAISKKTIGFFDLYYDIFYRFDREKIISFFNEDNILYYHLPKIYKKTRDGQSKLGVNEIEAINHFRRILKYINALVELRIEMEF